MTNKYIPSKSLIYLIGSLSFLTGCASWDDKTLTQEQRQKMYEQQRDRFRQEERDWWKR